MVEVDPHGLLPPTGQAEAARGRGLGAYGGGALPAAGERFGGPAALREGEAAGAFGRRKGAEI